MCSKQTCIKFLSIVFLASSYNLLGFPGDLDSTFGYFGTTTNTTDFIASMTVQPDDSIVTVGTLNSNFDKIYVARFAPNGAIDTSFNGSGSYTFSVGSSSQGEDITLQPNGDIVLCSFTIQSQPDFFIARLTSTSRTLKPNKGEFV